MKRIGWFTTARGPGSFNLFRTMLENIDNGGIEARLSFLFINREVRGNPYRTRMIAIAEDRGIPVIILPSDVFRPDLKGKDISTWRDEYGREMRERIAEHPMDLGVLAGYMLILDPETCRKNSIINLHPALPDTYQGTWEEVLVKVVENEDDSYGATIHLCTPELDRGETIAYDSFSIKELKDRFPGKDELIRQIRAQGVKREAILLMAVIKMVADGEIYLEGGKVLDRMGMPKRDHPNVADRIERQLRDR